MSKSPPKRRQSLQSLERGIAVIQVFSNEHPALTMSEVARLTGMTRATARRILLTLEELGLVRSDGRQFSLTPRVLSLGWAYLSSIDLWDVAMPLMEELSQRTNESCAAATLDLPDIVFVARVPRRIMTADLAIGQRLPAAYTAGGRVLLAELTDDELEDFLGGAELEAFTDRSITDASRMREAIEGVRSKGWSLVDQEFEIGLRSIATPLRLADGRTVAAFSLSAPSGRVALDKLRGEFLPELQRTAELITAALERHSPTRPPWTLPLEGGRRPGG
jgi:IclR family transcriptional regulator, pca regulon regulatory protein